MAKSKIIADFVNGDASIEIALKRIIVLTSDFDNKTIYEWSQNEIGGYPKYSIIPSYRIIKGEILGSYQLWGGGVIQSRSSVSLPTIGLPQQDIEEICMSEFRGGIIGLRDMARSNSCKKLLPVESYHLFEQGTNLTVTNAYVFFARNVIHDMISKLETIVLTLLIHLEKSYGILDGLDIELKSAKDQIDIERSLIQIIFNDNSVKIGDNNRISKSKIISESENE